MRKPRLIITMGDPAGVGPEIILNALKTIIKSHCIDDVDLCVYGDKVCLPGIEALPVAFRDFSLFSSSVAMGEVSAPCGHAAFVYLDAAIDACKRGEADGIVTCPLHKEALNLAGHLYPGHTEILAEKTGVKDFVMLLAWPNLIVSHVTTHVPVRKAVDLVTEENILSVSRVTAEALRRYFGREVRMAVGGLNPHAGENGLLGSEENEIIGPAVGKLCTEGLNVTGPLPPDTAFHRAYKGEFDVVIAMLHDHGHVAGKLLAFDEGVNCTLGLPFVRTSVGHGTAFDIAGQGKANCESLLKAITMAKKLIKT